VSELAKEFPWEMAQRFLMEINKKRKPATMDDIQEYWAELYEEWKGGGAGRARKEIVRLKLLQKLLKENER
jgi:hypothetical protein